MSKANNEILLIELAAASVKNKLSWRHSIYRSAPIGLYCLKGLDSDKIAVIDVPVTQIKDMLSLYDSSLVKNVICRLAEEPSTDEVKSIVTAIRESFPNAKVGCNFIKSDLTKIFDFVIYGTGKSAILNILRGIELNGYCDQMKNDLVSLLDLPKEPLIDVGYYMLPEKWLSVHNIEIWQPWLGLEEFSTGLFTFPGVDWLSNLLEWLTSSSFDSFHFNPSKWTVEEINLLRNTINKLKINISISFLSNESVPYRDILIPVKRIWLYEPEAVKMEEVTSKLKEIRAMGAEACLLISHSWFGNGGTLPACKYIDHIIIRDDYLWSNIELKKFMQRYWGTKNRFFTRLFGLRTASEFVTFLKSSYALLDTLFLPDNKGEKQ